MRNPKVNKVRIKRVIIVVLLVHCYRLLLYIGKKKICEKNYKSMRNPKMMKIRIKLSVSYI
jgi:hypothetical protein